MTRVTATLSALLLAVILFSVAPGAQAPTAQPGQVQSAALSANGDTGQFSLYQATGGAIQFSGTFVGTLQFEATINGTTWNALSVTPTAGGSSVTSATATGSWTFSNPGYTNVRVRASAWTSGNLIAQVTTVGPGVTAAGSLYADGTSTAPSIAFSSQTGTGWYYAGDGKVGLALGSGTTPMILFGGATSSFPGLKRNSAGVDIRLADDSAYGRLAGQFALAGTFNVGGTMLISGTAPTISSGFGTSPSVASSNGSSTFRINVGTGGVATSGVVGMPTATTGWNCVVQDMTNNTVTRMTASTTTTVTVTAAAAWAASDILNFVCFGF